MEFTEFIKEYWKIIAVVLIILVVIIITKKRKYFWKDKQGNKIGFIEFQSRLKKGIEGITPLQIAKSQVSSTWISVIGLICGLVTMIIVRIKNVWWWACISLVAGLLLTTLSQISNLQRYWNLKKVDKAIKDLENAK